MSRIRPRAPGTFLLVVASAVSVAVGAVAGLVVALPWRGCRPGAAHLLFLLTLCSVTVLMNATLARALGSGRRSSTAKSAQPRPSARRAS
ncbi:hypothetical protein ACWGB8_05410 [Kitasatospora sp. NPDC054939]